MKVYEIEYEISEGREIIFREDLAENHVAYGREDLVCKLIWFRDNGIKVREIDSREPNSTYNDVTKTYRKYIA